MYRKKKSSGKKKSLSSYDKTLKDAKKKLSKKDDLKEFNKGTDY